MHPTPPPAPRPILPDNLLRLPREVRDQIYYLVLKIASPLPIKGSPFNNIPPIFWKHPTLHVEALEAFYKTNTFTVNLDVNPNTNLAETWGPCPQAVQHIRHLIVFSVEHYSRVADFEEYERLYGATYFRRRWTQFLELPHLRSLKVCMQKGHDTSLFALDFGPILYHLRTLRPSISLTFKISFDSLLRAEWNDPWWQQFNNPRAPQARPTQPIGSSGNYAIYPGGSPLAGAAPDPYQPMGYIDVSDLITPPSDEDREYVKEYLSDKKMPATRSVKSGLLAETPANRRILGKHYVVKEPTLLRVLIQEHYEVYERGKREKRAREEEERILVAA